MATYKKGDYKVRCDRTGMVVNASDCRMEWNGLFVLESVWEARHPQDTVAASHDRQAVPNPRPEGEPTFIDATDVTAENL